MREAAKSYAKVEHDSTALPLEKSDIETVLAAADLDWSEIDPSILGTLFERGLDPGKGAQLGVYDIIVRRPSGGVCGSSLPEVLPRPVPTTGRWPRRS